MFHLRADCAHRRLDSSGRQIPTETGAMLECEKPQSSNPRHTPVA